MVFQASIFHSCLVCAFSYFSFLVEYADTSSCTMESVSSPDISPLTLIAIINSFPPYYDGSVYNKNALSVMLAFLVHKDSGKLPCLSDKVKSLLRRNLLNCLLGILVNYLDCYSVGLIVITELCNRIVVELAVNL